MTIIIEIEENASGNVSVNVVREADRGTIKEEATALLLADHIAAMPSILSNRMLNEKGGNPAAN